MFSLKSNLFVSMLVEAKDYAKTINLRRSHPPNLEADPRELNRMRSELRLAREHALAMSLMHRNRILSAVANSSLKVASGVLAPQTMTPTRSPFASL